MVRDRMPVSTTRLLVCGLSGALVMSIGVLGSTSGDELGTGASQMWPWLLTGAQVFALYSAGRRSWLGWLTGGCVQIPWIAYAIATSQIGFIPGCLISAAVQIYTFLHLETETSRMEALA